MSFLRKNRINFLVVLFLGICWNIRICWKFYKYVGNEIEFTHHTNELASRILLVENLDTIASISVPIGASIPHVMHYTWSNKNFSFENVVGANGGAQHSILKREQHNILARVRKIRRNNKGWDVKVWTDSECLDLMRTFFSEFYEDIGTGLNPRKLWDVARIAILYVHGGIYLDHDIACDEGAQFTDWIGNETKLLLLEPLRKNNKFASGNFFMGSVQGHPFWLHYLRNIILDVPKNLWVLEHTGPQQLAPTIEEYMVATNITNGRPSDEIRILRPDTMGLGLGQCKEIRDLDCSRPRCWHMMGISPSELIENRTKQVDQFNARVRFKQGNTTEKAVRREAERIKDLKGARGVKEKAVRRESETKRIKGVKGGGRRELALLPGEYAVPKCNPCTRPFSVDTSDASKKIIFIHIPKTGGTSVERHLNLTKPCHVTAAAIEKCDPRVYARAFSFSVLRHPIQRALSMYYYARQGGNGSNTDQKKYEWVKELNFHSFVEMLPKKKDFMYAPQTYFVTAASGQDQGGVSGSVPALKVNRVLCLESITNDWRELVESERDFDAFGNFSADLVRVSDKEDEVLVDVATEERLYEIYRSDFLLWKNHCGAL